MVSPILTPFVQILTNCLVYFFSPPLIRTPIYPSIYVCLSVHLPSHYPSNHPAATFHLYTRPPAHFLPSFQLPVSPITSTSQLPRPPSRIFSPTPVYWTACVSGLCISLFILYALICLPRGPSLLGNGEMAEMLFLLKPVPKSSDTGHGLRKIHSLEDLSLFSTGKLQFWDISETC